MKKAQLHTTSKFGQNLNTKIYPEVPSSYSNFFFLPVSKMLKISNFQG
jgi:hypothetical protein